MAAESEISLYQSRILIVEDDSSLRPIFAKLISEIQPGATITWVLSAEDFLLSQKVQMAAPWESFDLVITDVSMPGEASGFDVLKHFAKHSPMTPVVLMSGMSQLECMALLDTDLAMPAYLEKPLNIAECRALFARYLKPSMS